MAAANVNANRDRFKARPPVRRRSQILSEIARIDATIADIEDCYPDPCDPILFGVLQVSTRGETVALLRRYRRQLQREAA